MYLYGKNWSRREFESRVGRVEQVGGIRRVRLVEGAEDGVEQIQVRTGAGLTYNVNPHRGLDISLTEFLGSPISWQSQNGDAHPAYFQEEGTGWLRTAAGGLLMTCGMTQVGSPGEDAGEKLGIHGRVHHTPASHVTAVGEWIDDDYSMKISGKVQETKIFGENLELERTIESRLGMNVIRMLDHVTNIGFQRTPFMMLYHFNFGFPLISESTHFDFPSKFVKPREKETPLEGYNQWTAPDPIYKERVYYHSDLKTRLDSRLGQELADVTISNGEFPVGGMRRDVKVRLSWSADTLPNLVQWKNPGAGTHVMGIEPANCLVGGRKAEREAGTLRFLEPGQSVTHFLEITIE